MPPAGPPVPEKEAASAVDPARTALAIALGWVLPGAGHALLGRIRRGVLFFVIVMGSFALGVAHDGRLALRDPRQGVLTTLQVVANAGIGAADVLARLAVYGEATYTMPEDPSARRTAIFRDRARSVLSIYGTAYLWTAGLMNLLLLFDVWDIARGRKG